MGPRPTDRGGVAARLAGGDLERWGIDVNDVSCCNWSAGIFPYGLVWCDEDEGVTMVDVTGGDE